MGWFRNLVDGVKEFALEVERGDVEVPQPKHTSPVSSTVFRNEPAERPLRDAPEGVLRSAREAAQGIQDSGRQPAAANAPVEQAARKGREL